jgi:hypothetical protein
LVVVVGFVGVAAGAVGIDSMVLGERFVDGAINQDLSTTRYKTTTLIDGACVISTCGSDTPPATTAAATSQRDNVTTLGSFADQLSISRVGVVVER